MATEIYRFVNGEHSDYRPEVQPKDTYKALINAVRDESGQIISERGTVLTINFVNDLQINGFYVLNGEIIVALVSEDESISEIGILQKDGTYEAKVSNDNTNTPDLLLSENKLNFRRSNPIDIEGRKVFDGDRIIYFVDGLNDDSSLNLDDLPLDADFEETKKIQFSFRSPKPEIVDIEGLGALPTGVYSFTARYLTNGGDATSVGIFSNPASVVDEGQTVGRAQVDGAPPQTASTKAVTIALKNLDPNYPFIEIIAVTYIGVANTPQYSIIGRLDNTGADITFTYADTSQIIGSLTLSELTTQPTIYIKSKHIEQKDGVLFRANLEAETIDLDFQAVANSINAEYFITEVGYSENIQVQVDGQDWIPFSSNTGNPIFDETLNVVDVSPVVNQFEDYKDEVIATNNKGYMRSEVYSFALVPIFTNGTRGFAYHIPNNSVTPFANPGTQEMGRYTSSEAYPLNRGYPAGNIRHFRMPSVGQEPVFRVDGSDTFIRVLGVKFTNIVFPPNIRERLQGFYIVRQERNSNLNRTVVAQGLGKRIFNLADFSTVVPSYGKTSMQDVYDGNRVVAGADLDLRLFAFYAPDIIHGVIRDFGFSHIRRATIYTGVREWDGRGVGSGLSINNFINLTNVSLNETTDLALVQARKEINAFEKIGTTVEGTAFSLPFGGTNPYLLRKANGHLVLSLEGTTMPIIYSVDENYDQNQGGSETYFISNEFPSMELLLLSNLIDNVYGRVEQAQYIIADSVIFDVERLSPVDSSVVPETETYVYGGDTFISKYGLVINEKGGSRFENAPDSHSLIYFFLESQGNYNFRHFVESDIIGDSIETGTLPYYPKYTSLRGGTGTPVGLFNFSAGLGHSTGYNKQYSIGNSIIDFIAKPLLFTEETIFPNRVIRSEQTFEGELGDNYRIFLPNNFQDIGKSKGDITNIFVWNRRFYVHTERGLFLTFVNDRQLIITDVNKIATGSGGIFTEPPQEIFDIDGGYIGTTSKYAATVTPFGYFFIDNNRGKVFQLIEQAKEISDLGLFDFFRANIESLQDTPLNDVGFVGGYDYENKRWMLTKLGVGGFTKSFYIKLGNWTGSHTYQPQWYIDIDKQLFLSQEANVHEHNIGERGIFFAQPRERLELELSFNLPILSKVYDNLMFSARNIRRDGILNPFVFFNKLEAYTEDQYSGQINLLVSNEINPTLTNDQIKVSYKKREYRMSYPLDAVNDSSLGLDIFTNFDINKLFKGRITSEYCVAKFTFDNSDEDNDLFLEFIKLMFRPEII